MRFLSARLTKLRVAVGAGAIALGLVAAGATAAPAQANDGWHNGWRAPQVARNVERERQRAAWYRHHRVERHRYSYVPPRVVRPVPRPHVPGPWYYR